MVFVGAYYYFFEVVDSIANAREGSTSTRMLLYNLAFQMATEINIYTGIGVKPRGVLPLPIGSHSTWLGVFLKFGIVGVLLLCFFFISILKSTIKLSFCDKTAFRYLVATCLMIFLFFFFEDIDAPQMVCFLFFTLLGMSIKYKNENKI